MIEAELKARVREPAALHQRLVMLAAGQRSVHHDTYYDWPSRTLSADGRELRMRMIEAAGERRALFTYKEPAIDSASGSRPEYETHLDHPSAVDVILRSLGLECIVAFEKRCTSYRFAVSGREMLATVVQVPELDSTFIELQTVTSEDGAAAALTDVRALLARLGIEEGDLTSEPYAEAVIKSRQQQDVS
jgi:adenylate cyclase, class 2